MKSQTMRYLILAAFLALTVGMMAQDYKSAYQNIDKLTQEGKYRSALEAATTLFQQAQQAGDEDQMVKALAYRAAYIQELEEEGFEATLRLLRTELAPNPNRPVVAPVLHYLIGRSYYSFAQQNGYRLRNATATTRDSVPAEETPLADWNLQQLTDAAERHLLRGLEQASEQKTRLAEIPAIVKGGEATFTATPTLFDLLARESMELLGNPLLNVSDPVPEDLTDFLVSAEAFVNLPLTDFEEGAGTYRRLRLHQQLINFHLGPPSRPLLRVDVDRMNYLRQLGVADEAYLTALRAMHERYAGVTGRDILLVMQAQVYNRSDDKLGPLPKAEAIAILDQIKEDNGTVRALAQDLRRQINRKQLRVNVQEVYGRSDNLLFKLSYRNIDRVYHRLIKLKAPGEEGYGNRFDQDSLNLWKKWSAVAKNDFRLAKNDDYNTHSTETWLKSQPAGAYLLITSSGPKLDLDEEFVAINHFQITDLGLVKFDDGAEDFNKVLDRKTGAPRAGVKVTVEQQVDRQKSTWKTFRRFTTGPDGRIPDVKANRTQIRYRLQDGDDVFVSNPEYVYRNDRENRNRKRAYTPLFTDRSIYRPGQTVHVYGITLEQDRENMPQLLTDEKRTLTLYDVNGQEMGRAEVRSDAFSRFSHSFKLPEGGLTGNFRIQTEGGSMSFRVEEYKRPRFQVELEAPDFVVAGEEAEVSGKATLYAGPGLNDAKVSYRVFLEEVRYWWWGRGNNSNRELATSGETTTDGNGAFTVSFTPEKGLGKKRTRYRYVVETDVADDTGETHAAETSVALRSDKPVIGLRPSEEVLDVNDSLTIEASGSDENLTIDYRIVRVAKPDAALVDRKWPFPDRPVLSQDDYGSWFPDLAASGSKPLAEWQQLDRLYHSGQITLTAGKGAAALQLGGFRNGHYRIEWTYPDGTAGEPQQFSIVNTTAGLLPEGMLYHVVGADQQPEVGTPLEITLLSAVDLPQIAYSWASRKGFETDITGGGKRMVFRYLPSEEDRGGIQFNAAFLRFNQLRQFNQRFYLGWDNKKLQIDYATFRDKLRPGAPEEWTLTVKNADGSPIAAAALASMYDASLDQIYRGRNWSLNPFPNFGIYRNFASLVASGLQNAYGRWNQPSPEIITPEGIPSLDLGPFPWDGYGGGLYPQSYSAPTIRRRIAGAPGDGAAMTMRAAPAPAMAESKASVAFSDEVDSIIIVDPEGELAADQPAADTPVQIRKNLQETAFWMPTLTSNAAGELKISFTSPEALTSWNLRVLAHDKDLNAGVSTQTVLTQKELIVLPNVPRFVREGDAIELTARVNNLTEEAMLVKARVEFFDPATNEPLALGAAAGAGACVEEQSIAANSGASFCFPISIPEGLSSDGPIGYRIVARGGDFSDGEENIIPVLTDRTLVTVSQPFYLKRKQKKSVTLPVLASNNSATLRHVGYTFQATTNPAWLALKALPYLMEYPYDCTEQLANRYFANQLAFATVSRKPVLEEVFRQWQADTNALKSELERNPTLKNALLTETPWLRAAQSEAEQRARISNLFDLKKLADEQVTALEKLANRQDPNGHFSWFPGGRENRYMTQYVLETMGRMQQLGVVTPDQAARVSGISSAAINWLDQQMTDDYRRLQEQMKDQKNWQKDYRPSSTVVHYLYARSQSSGDLNPDRAVGEALAFFEERAKAKWLDYDLYEQALIAITYATPQQASRPQSEVTQKIITSLRERAIRKDEFGMYWKYGRGYRWQNLPIETHCRILEAFQAAGGTTEELDEMRLWLLTNKRTNRWPTTKSTAAAVYALLNAGTDWTKTDGKPLKVSWPGLAKKNGLSTRVGAAQNSAEAATGAFSVSAQAGEITADLATVQVKNRENELVWGGVYWQYTELAQKVEASTGGPLSLERELFHRIPTEDGMRLEPITADKPLSAGDRVTVRLILRSDRDLDFVHLKDRRAATFEPIEQLSGYQYKNGLGYYFAPGDLATNFFVDHLPKGTYTLEYDLFATYSGSFSNGLGRVQSMYAPEFGANTAGARIVVE